MFTESETRHTIPLKIRRSYIDAISSITPYDELEKTDFSITLQWLKSTGHLNKPHNMAEHLGVLAIILSPDRTHTLLINHHKAGLWLPPGGHVDLGQGLHECAIKEAEEEIGLRNSELLLDTPVFISRTITQGVNAGHNDVTSWFLLEANIQDSYQIQAKEATTYTWVPVSTLLASAHLRHLHRGFKKLVQWGFVQNKQ